MLKKTVILLYVLLIFIMAGSTIIEHYTDTPTVNTYIYGAWWFSLLWGLLAGGGLWFLLQTWWHRKGAGMRLGTLTLHISLIIILLGALLTHLTAYKGTIHLRSDQPTNQYTVMTSMTETETHTLPFYVRLDRFQVVHHAGTTAPADYITQFSIIDGPRTIEAQVSMNHVYSHHGIRFYQASYDNDNSGSYLSINSDPYGIAVTYTGYALLFISLIWMLLDPKGTFRHLLKHPLLRKGLFATTLLLATTGVKAATTVSAPTAEKFGELFVLYNNRVCPMQTLAYDFTKKIYGRTKYQGLTPEQVFMSWIFYHQEWDAEPIILIKNGEMKQRFGLDSYASVNQFFRQGHYLLGPSAAEYAQGQQDAFHKACADIDGKLQVIMSLRQGTPLIIFPHTFKDGHTQWFSPFEQYPKSLPTIDILFYKNVFPIIYSMLQQGDEAGVRQVLDKIRVYQQQHAGSSLPSSQQVLAERIYNRIPFTTILFIVNLTLGFLCLTYIIVHLTSHQAPSNIGQHRWTHRIQWFMYGILSLSWMALTFVMALRWIISGNIPLSNGYETMLSTAWFTLLITMITAFLQRRLIPLITTFGFLLSGFFLLVSHISQMDPAIGPMMPVLNSPLLSIHVSITMMSYALLSLTFICGLTAIVTHLLNRQQQESIEALQVLSRLFLYPAITTLGLGIFIGAIWANISWGTYWSWDPKETWALITFMVYAVVLHTQSLPIFRQPMAYHLYLTCAFLTILITYFGVNYVLGGMHSYA